MRGIAWKTARGSLGLWNPAPNVMAMALRGHGEAAFVEPIVALFARLSGPALHLFADVAGLSSYDSALRTGLTARFARDRARIVDFPILLGSKIVAMGVAVANLALGGVVTAHTSRERFTGSVDKTLFALSVTGFSSNALANFSAQSRDEAAPDGRS